MLSSSFKIEEIIFIFYFGLEIQIWPPCYLIKEQPLIMTMWPYLSTQIKNEKNKVILLSSTFKIEESKVLFGIFGLVTDIWPNCHFRRLPLVEVAPIKCQSGHDSAQQRIKKQNTFFPLILKVVEK